MDYKALSERVKNMTESATLQMSQRSRELKAQGVDVINLSIGEPDFNTPECIKEAAKKAIDDNYTHYTPVSGVPELRKAIAGKFRRDNHLDYSMENIVVSNGAKQSIANAIQCLVNPGEEVLVPAPYWVSYPEIVKLAGGVVVELQAGIDVDFKVTPKQLEEAITSKTKVFLFSSPCNPTGTVYTREELRALADVFARYPDIFIISDEIYEYINFIGKHESIAQFDSIKERVIVVNGVSKGYAMTGWRIGYIATNPVIAKACDTLQGQYTSGASSIAQMASLKAVSEDPEKNHEMMEMIRIFKERRDMVLKLMEDISGLKNNVPDGAFYIFPNITSLFGKSDGKTQINNATDLCMYLLDEVHVAAVPGDAFGNPNCIRISYATSNELLVEALGRIKTAVEKLK